MGSGRDKRRRPKHKRRPKRKTMEKLISVLVSRPHKWTTLRRLAEASCANDKLVDRFMTKLANEGAVAMQTCASWEGHWRYKPLPKCWPEDAQIRELLIAEATALGLTDVSAAAMATNVSKEILGFEAPNTVLPTINAMLSEGELRHTVRERRTLPSIDTDKVCVPVNNWLKRTRKEQIRARMV